MRYTDSKATAHYEAIPEPTMHTVDIGEVSDDTASWWLSVLASGEGWKAAIKQSDGGEFLTPWSVTRPSEQSLAIKWRSKDSTEAQAPPLTPQSSKKAFEAPSPSLPYYTIWGVSFLLLSPWPLQYPPTTVMAQPFSSLSHH